jgi:hypothetical protein
VVEHRAERVDVRAFVDGFALGLLGRIGSAVAASRSFASPQSITTVSPKSPTRTLPGLRSR